MGKKSTFSSLFSFFTEPRYATEGVNTAAFKGRKDKRKRIESERQEKTGKTGACAVSFDRGPLQRYQMEASE